MTNFLLLIIIIILLYQVYTHGKLDNKEKKQKNYNDILPSLKGKCCEISWERYFNGLDYLQVYSDNTKGTIIDFDDEWIIIEIQRKKENVYEVIRKSFISDIKEIYENE